MQLKVAQQIKKAAQDLCSGDQVKLLKNYEGQPAAISVFDFSLFVQCVAKAAVQVAKNDETLYSDESEAFVDALSDLRLGTVDYNTVIY